MTLKSNNVPSTGGSDFEPVEPGTYPARIVSIVDMGLQEQRPYKGKEKPPKYEIQVTYELLDEFLLDEDGNELLDKPRWIFETLTLHNLDQDRAKSTIRYNALDPEHEYDGDWEQLLNTPCMVSVVHNKNVNSGKVYANVSVVSQMRVKQAEKAKELVNDPVLFTLDDPSVETFLKFHERVQDKIKQNIEFEGSLLEERLDNWEEGEEEEPEENGEDW